MADLPNDFNDAARVRSILMTVVRRDDIGMLDELLDNGGLKPDTEMLREALQAGCSVQAVRRLVQYGAAPDRDIMMLALKHRGGYNTLEALRDYPGFTPDMDLPAGLVKQEDLIDAVRRKDFPQLRTLFAADLSLVPSAAVLIEAIGCNCGVEVLDLLLRHKPVIDESVMMCAARHAYHGYMHSLLTRGNVRAESSVLREAVSLGNYNVAEVLLRVGEAYPDSLLMHDLVTRARSERAMKGDPIEMAKLLLKYNAYVGLETMEAAVKLNWKPMVSLIAPKLQTGKNPSSPKL